MQLPLLKIFTGKNIRTHTTECINQRQTLLRSDLYSGAQWQMPQHIFLWCKDAQDHLWMMNHDSLGFDKTQVDGERRQGTQLLSEQPTNAYKLGFFPLLMSVWNMMYYHKIACSLIDFTSEKAICLHYLLPPFYFLERTTH